MIGMPNVSVKGFSVTPIACTLPPMPGNRELTDEEREDLAKFYATPHGAELEGDQRAAIEALFLWLRDIREGEIAQVALKAGLSDNTLRRWRRAEGLDISMSSLIKLLRVCGSADELLGVKPSDGPRVPAGISARELAPVFSAAAKMQRASESLQDALARVVARGESKRGGRP